MTLEELALAYELHEDGCCWKRIAQGLGYDPDYIKLSVFRAKRFGIGSRMNGFGIDKAKRRYKRATLAAAKNHRAFGDTWRVIAGTLLDDPTEAAGKRLRGAVLKAEKAGHI